MINTESRVTLAREKAKIIRKQREKVVIHELMLICSILGILWIAVYAEMIRGIPKQLDTQMYGSMVLSDNAGGYVLVGVISFVAAVALTLLCLKYRNRKKNDSKKGQE